RRRRLPRTRQFQRPLRDGMTITLLVTDQDLNIIGDPLDGWTNLDCTKRFNEPGSGTVELPASPEAMEILQPGHRLVVMRDGQVWMAGPMEVPKRSRSVTGAARTVGRPRPARSASPSPTTWGGSRDTSPGPIRQRRGRASRP